MCKRAFNVYKCSKCGVRVRPPAGSADYVWVTCPELRDGWVTKPQDCSLVDWELSDPRIYELTARHKGCKGEKSEKAEKTEKTEKVEKIETSETSESQLSKKEK